ncbi:unnamed protein product [Rotaria sordida]|uniref:F-box domain-containing protein n=1 Tax=Rotaria sordida TaxID=392033 RepID=A0A814B2Z4_9BILA|nr:unnamed protein product [Rotaria sordida]
MNTSNNNDINILDLPDEMLLIILSKLDMVDVFYSLVNLNKRFNQLVFDPLYIHHLDLTVKTSFVHNSPVDNQIFDQICTKILPRLHCKVNKITVTSLSMEFIFNTIDYPQLHLLSLVNFQQETLLQYLTRYQHVDTYFNVMKIEGRCHVYSLPYQFDTFLHLTNSFRRGNFYTVRWLIMNDVQSFEHEFFQIISQDFPFLQRLTVYNFEPQKNKQHSSTLITSAEVFELNLLFAHIDYVEEFLSETNIRFPRLTILAIKYELSAMVTNNFTNDAARFNLSQL